MIIEEYHTILESKYELDDWILNMWSNSKSESERNCGDTLHSGLNSFKEFRYPLHWKYWAISASSTWSGNDFFCIGLFLAIAPSISARTSVYDSKQIMKRRLQKINKETSIGLLTEGFWRYWRISWRISSSDMNKLPYKLPRLNATNKIMGLSW